MGELITIAVIFGLLIGFVSWIAMMQREANRGLMDAEIFKRKNAEALHKGAQRAQEERKRTEEDVKRFDDPDFVDDVIRMLQPPEDQPPT